MNEEKVGLKLLGKNGWLKRKAENSPTDIIIYFAGHGISNLEEKTLEAYGRIEILIK